MMLKPKIIIVYANSLGELQIKSLGYNHDHCRRIYFGKTINISLKYKALIESNFEYCGIFEEDIPTI